METPWQGRSEARDRRFPSPETAQVRVPGGILWLGPCWRETRHRDGNRRFLATLREFVSGLFSTHQRPPLVPQLAKRR